MENLEAIPSNKELSTRRTFLQQTMLRGGALMASTLAGDNSRTAYQTEKDITPSKGALETCKPRTPSTSDYINFFGFLGIISYTSYLVGKVVGRVSKLQGERALYVKGYELTRNVDFIDKLKEATVRISQSFNGELQAHCGGSFIFDERTLISAAHVLINKEKTITGAQVHLAFSDCDGKLIEFASRLKSRFHPSHDIIVIRFSQPMFDLSKALSIGTYPTDPQPVIACGMGVQDFRITIGVTENTNGVAERIAKEIRQSNIHLPGTSPIQMIVHPGDSGGPVVTADGKAVGIIVANTRGTSNAYVYPLDESWIRGKIEEIDREFEEETDSSKPLEEAV